MKKQHSLDNAKLSNQEVGELMWKPQKAQKAQNQTQKPANLDLEQRLVGMWGLI